MIVRFRPTAKGPPSVTTTQHGFFDDDPIRHGCGRRRHGLVLPRHLDAWALQAPELQGDTWRPAHQIIKKWIDLDEGRRLERLNETTLRGDFLAEVFGEALGFTRPSSGAATWNLHPEYSLNGGTADAAVGLFSQDAPTVPRALIEVKGPTVNLDRDRAQGRTPVQQLWDYLNATPDCPWGILTNFVSFRLYHRDKTPYVFEHFALRTLRDENAFRKFFVLFSKNALLPRTVGQIPWADRLLADAENRQKTVGDELYKQYSKQRQSMIWHLTTALGKPLDLAIHIAQKLLDRIIFVAFCEDRRLLPENSIDRAWTTVSAFARVTNPKWRNFLDLFRSVDQGNPRQGVDPYNGGLFRDDPEVDNLQLDDDWTDFFRSVGQYDFESEVNVDVLGHLFERSVTELEKIRVGGLFAAPLPKTRKKPAKSAEMPKSAQRKRSGIYYTPPEFTDLIARMTIDAVLDDRFRQAARSVGIDLDDAPSRLLLDGSTKYWFRCLDVLRDLKVCDPACGSGAFLIKAYERLEDRYDEVVEKLRSLGHPDAGSLADQIPDLILEHNLFGVDLSEEAVEITQLALWIRTARRGKQLSDLSRNIVCGNSLVENPNVDPRAMTWRDAFPAVFGREGGGFDCVIGNPPWERLKLQEREFFSFSAPDIAASVSAADRRKKIAALEKKNPEFYARYLDAKSKAERVLGDARSSGHYPLTGKGDVNTYMLFAERARTLVAPSGRVGLLVPSGIATDDTTKEFFNELMDAKSLIALYDFENKRPFFPDVHRSFKFSTLAFGGTGVTTSKADFVFFARKIEDLKTPKRHIPLTVDDLALVNPNTRTCPIFRSRRDADLTKRIYERVPILIDHNRRRGGNPWGIRFVRMFDQTNDAELFHTPEQLKKLGYKRKGSCWKKSRSVFLPLYEAKMVQAYDHRAASVVIDEENWFRQGQKKGTTLVLHQNPEFGVVPRWWIEDSAVRKFFEGRQPPALLAFKNVTSPTNQRTMIAAFIPFTAVGNSAPLVLIQNDISVRTQCCLLANLDSFALDYVARQKVGNVNLNFFIVEQLPIFPPDRYSERCPWNSRQTLERWISDRVLKLTCTAEDMLPLAEAAEFKGGVHNWNEDERAELMAELDAAYFRLYGLSRDEVKYVLSTFSRTRSPDGSEGKSSAVAGRILSAFDELA